MTRMVRSSGRYPASFEGEGHIFESCRVRQITAIQNRTPNSAPWDRPSLAPPASVWTGKLSWFARQCSQASQFSTVRPRMRSNWLSKHVLRRGRGIVDFRKTLFQRLHRFEQGDQSALTHRLDHQTIAVAVHDRFIARQLELHGNANRLIGPLRNSLTCLWSGIGYLQAYALDRCHCRPCYKGLLGWIISFRAGPSSG